MYEIVRVEERASEPVRERERERGGRGGFREPSWTPAPTLQSFFCFSEETVFSTPCLSVRRLLLLLLCHEPRGHFDPLAHLEKRRETPQEEEEGRRRTLCFPDESLEIN